MAFLYPDYFPAGCCVIETDSDPALLRVGFTQFYPVGVSLEQAMAWIWKSRAFTGSGSGQQFADCCGYLSTPPNLPIYYVYSFPNSQSTSEEDAAKTKMSEIACGEGYWALFLFEGTEISQSCSGPPGSLISAEAYFSFQLGTVFGFPWPIYLYNEKYYLSVDYTVGPQALNFRDINENAPEGITYFVGNLTIDGINFPLYAPPPESCATPQTNFTCTTSLEREAN
jgi:hypothetical protein